jgi:hypothetical protein
MRIDRLAAARHRDRAVRNRPAVLLAPPVTTQQIASNVMVHWNGSTEQARANAFAMPLRNWPTRSRY